VLPLAGVNRTGPASPSLSVFSTELNLKELTWRLVLVLTTNMV
jgi:hypothetical protein